MSGKTIDDLREHLFATLAGVRDGSISLDQARTISDIAQVVVNTAKVEVDYIRATDRSESRFLGAAATDAADPTRPAALPNGIVSMRRHLIRDE